MVLLIVVNHEKPQEQQPAENAAHHFSREVGIPVSPRQRRERENCRRKNVPPAFDS